MPRSSETGLQQRWSQGNESFRGLCRKPPCPIGIVGNFTRFQQKLPRSRSILRSSSYPAAPKPQVISLRGAGGFDDDDVGGGGFRPAAGVKFFWTLYEASQAATFRRGHAQPGAWAILECTMPRHRPVTQRPGRYGLARRPACEHAHAQFSGFVYKNKRPTKKLNRRIWPSSSRHSCLEFARSEAHSSADRTVSDPTLLCY